MEKGDPRLLEYARRYRELHPERCRAADYKWKAANRDKVAAQIMARNHERRDRLAAIKVASGCVDCGYTAHAEALDFDHLPGEVKRFGLSTVGGRSWAVVEEEIAKCEVVCANCHRIRTATRRPDIEPYWKRRIHDS